VSFGYFPEAISAAKAKEMGTSRNAGGPISITVETEEGIEVPMWAESSVIKADKVLLVVLNEMDGFQTPEWVKDVTTEGSSIVLLQPRGFGRTKWTRKNGPNYVERSHALLGRTVDAGWVWDVIAAAKFLSSGHNLIANGPSGTKRSVVVAGQGPAGVIATYAAALDESIAGAVVVQLNATHMESAAPQFLNVLRVCDVPVALGLIAPRPLTVCGAASEATETVTSIFRAAGAQGELTVK
jgi:hypothetical protein